jgi:hypothetical protein
MSRSMAVASDVHETTGSEIARSRNAESPVRVATWCAAGLAVVETLLAMAHGPGLTYDSTTYLSTGLNFAHGHGLTPFFGGRLTVFPPGLPLVVALGERLGLETAWTMRLFNAALFAITVVLASLLLRRHVRSQVLIIGTTFFIALSVPMISVVQMAVTEVPFIPICLAFILVFELAAESERVPWSLLASAAVLTCVAFGFRYAGMALIPIGALATLLGLRHLSWRARAVSAAFYGSAASVLPALLVLRNRQADGTWLGPRPPSSDSLRATITRVAVTAREWIVPDPAPVALQRSVGVAVVVIALVLAVRWFRDRRRGSQPPRDQPGGSVLILVVFTIGYASYIVIAQVTTAISPLDNRLLSPLYVPMVVLAVIALERCSNVLRPRVGTRALRVTGAVVLVLFTWQVITSARELRSATEDGAEYASSMWRDSTLVAAVGRLPAAAVVYSNQPPAIWAGLQRNQVINTPPRVTYRTDQRVDVAEQFLRDTACRPTYVAWFTIGDPVPNLYSPAQLERVARFEVVSKTHDGTLFRARRNAPRSECHSKR